MRRSIDDDDNDNDDGDDDDDAGGNYAGGNDAGGNDDDNDSGTFGALSCGGRHVALLAENPQNGVYRVVHRNMHFCSINISAFH